MRAGSSGKKAPPLHSAGRVAALGQRELGQLVIDRRARPARRARRGPRDRGAARASKRSGWSGPATTRSPVLRRKASLRVLAFALALQLDRDERRVLDLDVELLDRRDQHEAAVRLAPQDGREQPHHRRPADRAALVIPGAVARDPHLAVAAMARVPASRPAAACCSSAMPGDVGEARGRRGRPWTAL